MLIKLQFSFVSILMFNFMKSKQNECVKTAVFIDVFSAKTKQNRASC